MSGPIVIHAGESGADIPAIHDVLARGLWSCRSARILLPQAVRPGALARSLEPGATAKERERPWKALAEAASRTGPDPVVVSAPALENADPFRLKQAIDTHLAERADSLRIVVYLLPHAERALLAYREHLLNSPAPMAMDSFMTMALKNGRILRARHVARWKAALGERYVLRPAVASALFRGSVVADFLKHVLGREDFQLSRPAAPPGRHDPRDLSVLHESRRILTDSGLPAPDIAAIQTELARLMAQDPAPPSRPLPPCRESAKRLFDACLNDAQAIDAAFPEGTPMTDALRQMAEEAEAGPQQSALSEHFPDQDAALIRAFLGLAGAMAAIDPGRWPGHLGHEPPRDHGWQQPEG